MHHLTVTLILSSCWLPPQPGVHLMAEQSMQTLYELLVMAHKAK